MFSSSFCSSGYMGDQRRLSCPQHTLQVLHTLPRRQLPDQMVVTLRHNQSLSSLITPRMGSSSQHRLSQPDIAVPAVQYRPVTQHGSPLYQRRVLPNPAAAAQNTTFRQNSGGIARKLMKRCTNPDLMRHLQRTTELAASAAANRASCEPAVVDPVYLALKQATGRYSRRGSNFESASPSPRNLSQVSLQDSGYVEMGGSNNVNPLLGSTPQLDNAGRSVGRRRAPKLTQQMKSLSLDCQDMPPRMTSATRSPLRNKLVPRKTGLNGSSDLSDAERSCSPSVKSRRSSSSTVQQTAGYIVIHEYTPSNGPTLTLGEKVHVVDNGDPDWLHGFRFNDRTEHLITFPATCVSQVHVGEQAMRIQQNVLVAEQKLRMYRDQIVFVQPETLENGKVTVRTEHNAYAPCPLSSLAML